MKHYIDDHSINHNSSYIIGIWNISELGDCAMTFPSHVVDDFIPGKLRRMKDIHWNLYISTFWRNISLSLEELVPVMVSK